MQHTFHLKATNLSLGFLYMLKKLFGDKEIKIVVEDVEDNIAPQQAYQSLLDLRERFKNARIDPNIDISGIANEVNL